MCTCWYIPVQFLTVHVYWHYCPYYITTSFSNPAGVEVSRSNVRRVFNSLELFKLAAKLIGLSCDTAVMQSGCLKILVPNYMLPRNECADDG